MNPAIAIPPAEPGAPREPAADVSAARASATDGGLEVYPDWAAVYRDAVSGVYRLMLGKVGNRPDAEDLTATVFVTALPALRLPADVTQVHATLVATARRVLTEYWHHRVGRQITTVDEDEALESVPAGMAAAGDANRVRAVLARLPERSRRILQLRFLDSRTLRQAAATMGVSVRCARVVQYGALRQAAHILDGATP